MVAFCAEFPNDNPALHDGALVVVTSVRGGFTVELPERRAPIALAPEPPVLETPVELTPEPIALVADLVAELEPVLGEDEEAPPLDHGVEPEHDGLLEALMEAVEPIAAAEPIAAEPIAEEPIAEEPIAVEPVAVEPAALEPAAVEPVAVEPDALEPASLEEPTEPDAIAVADWAEEWKPEEVSLEGAVPAPAESAVVLAAPAESGVVLAAAAIEEPAEEPIVVEPIEAFEPAEVYATSELPPESDDPFHVFVVTVADACVAAGELAVAAALPSLLFTGQIAEGRADDQAMAALVAAGWLEREEGGFRIREPLRSEALGWQAILRGTSDDFGACGPLPLDEWSARLVAGLCAKPEKETVFRRELRSRGVAAFGLAA